MRRGYAGIVRENNKNARDLSHVQSEMGKTHASMMSRSCSVCGKDGTGMTTKVGGLIRSCAPRSRREEVEYIRRHKMYTRVSRETVLA